MRNKALFAGLLIGISVITILSISAEESLVPSWIKTTVGFWISGDASDREFINAVEWMVENKIIKIRAVEETEMYRGGFQHLQTEYNKLDDEYLRMKDLKEYWEKRAKNAESRNSALSLENILEKSAQKMKTPQATIGKQIVTWEFYDSLGNFYTWTLPIESYEAYIRAPEPLNTVRLQLDDGSISVVRDHTKFVRESFKDVIDNVYDNAGDDTRFVYEIWYIVSQLTTYSKDIGEDPRWAVETFTRGGGDCEDLAILIADMIKSSKHSKNWDIEMIYFDSDNPSRAKKVNHVALRINDGDGFYFIEPTAKTLEELNYWNEIGVSGWNYPV